MSLLEYVLELITVYLKHLKIPYTY